MGGIAPPELWAIPGAFAHCFDVDFRRKTPILSLDDFFPGNSFWQGGRMVQDIVRALAVIASFGGWGAAVAGAGRADAAGVAVQAGTAGAIRRRIGRCSIAIA